MHFLSLRPATVFLTIILIVTTFLSTTVAGACVNQSKNSKAIDGLNDCSSGLICDGLQTTDEFGIGSYDRAGWTKQVKGEGTRVFYISADGSDENNGRSPEAPLATFAKAKNLIKKQESAWILLKRGDVFGFRINLTELHGESKDNPIVISSYGESKKRPVIKNKISAVKSSSNINIIGLHTTVESVTKESSHISGLRFVGNHHNILLEDNYFEYGTVTFQKYGNGSTMHNISIRRNIISRAFSMDSHSQGLYASGVDNLVIEENLFDHNGWVIQSKTSGRDHAEGQATFYNHNMYINSSNNIRIHNNLIFRAASMGIKMRSDEEGASKNISIKNNVFFEGEIGVGIGGNTSEKFRFVNASIEDNIFLSVGSTRPTSRNISWPIEAKDIFGLIIRNNIIAGQENHNGSFALKMEQSMKDVLVEKNIVYGVNQAGFIFKSESWENVIIRENIIHDSENSKSRGILLSGDRNGLSFYGNKVFLRASEENLLDRIIYQLENIVKDRDVYHELTESEASLISPLNFFNPKRDLISYYSILNETASKDSFIDTIIAVRTRFRCDTDYSTEAFLEYMSEGFEAANFRNKH